MELLRLTRHPATEAQVKEIARLWGDVDINFQPVLLSNNPRTASEHFDSLAGDADIAELVSPVNILDYILKHSR